MSKMDEIKKYIFYVFKYIHILYHLQGFPLQSDQRLLNKAAQVPRELSALSLKDDIVSHERKAELDRKKTKCRQIQNNLFKM